MVEEIVCFECPRCGVSVDKNDKECKYCKSPIYVRSSRDLSTILDRGGINKNPQQVSSDYISFYRKKLLQNSTDIDSLFGLGLFYIETKQVEKAVETLEKAKDISPQTASIYFYLALAMVCKKRPRVMCKKEVLKIEDQLEAARCINPEMGILDILLAVIKYDFYVMNGLRASGPSPEELLTLAKEKHVDSYDRDKILELCIFNGNPVLSSIKEMRC